MHEMNPRKSFDTILFFFARLYRVNDVVGGGGWWVVVGGGGWWCHGKRVRLLFLFLKGLEYCLFETKKNLE